VNDVFLLALPLTLMSSFPDYYSLLGVTPSATQDQIRQAYKKESLKTHPDRLVNATPQERQRATAKFQAVADAYYVLSDINRRRDYDLQYQNRTFQERTPDPAASANFFANFANMFSGGTSSSSNAGQPEQPGRPDAEATFTDVFEELLRPEVERTIPWWSWIGAICGAGLGFIIANVPGLVAGGVAGNRLGAIRDAKGKSVAVVFASLGGEQKAQILRALAMKVLGSAL